MSVWLSCACVWIVCLPVMTHMAASANRRTAFALHRLPSALATYPGAKADGYPSAS